MSRCSQYEQSECTFRWKCCSTLLYLSAYSEINVANFSCLPGQRWCKPQNQFSCSKSICCIWCKNIMYVYPHTCVSISCVSEQDLRLNEARHSLSGRNHLICYTRTTRTILCPCLRWFMGLLQCCFSSLFTCSALKRKWNLRWQNGNFPLNSYHTST